MLCQKLRQRCEYIGGFINGMVWPVEQRSLEKKKKFTNNLACTLVAPDVEQSNTQGQVRTCYRCCPSKDLFEILLSEFTCNFLAV
jgi:hypothetical protein